MKNLNSKRPGLLAKGITTLSLSLAFQADCCSPGRTAGHMANKIADRQSDSSGSMVQHIKDVSCWTDNKNQLMLFSTAKHGEYKKAEEILERFIAQKKNPNFIPKNEDFINTLDTTTQTTAIGIAIIKGHINVVNLFVKDTYKAYIDINKVGNSSTSILLALKNKKYDIANILLIHPDIDIKTKEPTSGNTALHLAIEKKFTKITKTLISKFKTQAPELLFAQNEEGNTPLHLAMAHELPDVQDVLINLASKDKEKLWIKNNKGKTAIDVAIRKNQMRGMVLFLEAPLEKFCEKHKNKETLLHTAARLNLPDAIKVILNRINTLSGTDEVIKQLFETTNDGKTVWEYIYLSRLGIQPVEDSMNIKIFKETIEFVKEKLNTAHRDAILEGINRRADKNRLQGGISKAYADTLRKIVNDTIPFSKPRSGHDILPQKQ